MSRNFFNMGVLAVGVLCGAPVAAHAETSPLGVWLNDTGRGAIEITQCGSKICGHVVWTKSQADRANGCGKQIIGNVSQVSSSMWDKGWIYSPERQRKYSVELKPLSSDRLRVKGYKGSKFFSKSMVWTRAPADLERCNGADTAVIAATSEPQAQPQSRSIYGTGKSPEPARPSRSAPRDEPDVSPKTDDVAEARGFDLEGGPLEGLDIDKYFKKTDGGDCNINTPWVKLRFKCD